MNADWNTDDVYYDRNRALEGSQWSLPSPDALWDSLHQEQSRACVPVYRRKNRRREKLQNRFQDRPPLRVAFRQKDSTESPSESDRDSLKIVHQERLEKQRKVENPEKNEPKQNISSNSTCTNLSVANNESSNVTTSGPSAAMTTAVPFPLQVYQTAGQWGPSFHPHFPLISSFLPPIGMPPSMIQPFPTVLPVVVYSTPPGPGTMGVGMQTVGSGPVVVGSGPVTAGGGSVGVRTIPVGGGTLGMGGVGQVVPNSVHAAASSIPVVGTVHQPTSLPPAGTAPGNVQPWISQSNVPITHVQECLKLLENPHFGNEIFYDLLKDVIREEAPKIFSDLREEMYACCGWFASDLVYLAARGVVEDIVGEVAYSSSSGIVSEAIDDLHKLQVSSPKRVLNNTVLATAMGTMDDIIQEIVRTEACEAVQDAHSTECVVEWLEEFVGEIATDCYHEEVFAESTKRRKQVSSIVSEYIVEPEMFDEALGLALDPTGGAKLLSVSRVRDCVLDEVLLSCVLSLSLDQRL